MKILSKLFSFECCMVILLMCFLILSWSADDAFRTYFYYSLSVFVGVSFMVTGKIVETIKKSKGK